MIKTINELRQTNVWLRLWNKEFWKAFVPAILLLIQTVAAVFGYTLDLGDIGNKILAAVDALFVVFSIIGIYNDTTTPGLRDSPRALSRKKLGED